MVDFSIISNAFFSCLFFGVIDRLVGSVGRSINGLVVSFCPVESLKSHM